MRDLFLLVCSFNISVGTFSSLIPILLLEVNNFQTGKLERWTESFWNDLEISWNIGNFQSITWIFQSHWKTVKASSKFQWVLESYKKILELFVYFQSIIRTFQCFFKHSKKYKFVERSTTSEIWPKFIQHNFKNYCNSWYF